MIGEVLEWRIEDVGRKVASQLVDRPPSDTRWTDWATGRGDTPLDALEDALCILANAGVATMAHQEADMKGFLPKARDIHTPCMFEYIGELQKGRHLDLDYLRWHEECDVYYFVTVMVRVAES